jgi:SAM-dependent methyltransferase
MMTAETSPWEDAVRWLRDQPGRQDLVRDAYYDDPLTESAERFRQSNEWAATHALIGAGEGRTALDIGAGRGIASYALARDGWKVTALEPDPSPLVGAAAIRQLAASTGVDIQVEQTLSERLPFADATFDLVYGRAVLHHIGDLPAACREFARVLKPGGRVLAVREHVISREEDRERFFDLHPLHHRYGGENAYQVHVYRDALAQAGLQVEASLGPLETAINYAPHSEASLKSEIAAQVGARVSLGKPLAALALGMPVAGRLLLKQLQRIDHRPGRHYSFVARRP